MKSAFRHYQIGVCWFALTNAALAAIVTAVSVVFWAAPQDAGSAWITSFADHATALDGLSGLSLVGMFLLFWMWMRHTGWALRAVNRPRAQYRLLPVQLFCASPLVLCALGLYLTDNTTEISFQPHTAIGAIAVQGFVRIGLGLGWAWLAVLVGRGIEALLDPNYQPSYV